MGVIRFIETVRHLRAGQIAAQVGNRLPRIRNGFSGNAPAMPSIRSTPVAPFLTTSTSPEHARLPSTGRLTFLNREKEVGWPIRWDVRDASPLWQYNLHYHDYLWNLPFEQAAEAVLDWIRHCPEPAGAGWEPYPLSIRLQNWCMLFFGQHLAETLDKTSLATTLWRSVFAQSRRLERNLERHILGNHLLENGAALAFVGATFDGTDADRWLDRGLEILAEQLDEIVLPDGGHVERSPMYQARLCLMLDNLSRTGCRPILDVVGDRLEKSLHALRLLLHPDGQIALLNDSAFGIYPLPPFHSPPPNGCFSLPDSGYFGASTSEGHYVVCDAGPIGPDYQPGHAHGDTLSFELSLGGQRFVVDAGVSSYEIDSWRKYARSTAAHNTVRLNRADQSDFWAAFRVGSRAYPRNVEHNLDETGFYLGAEHTGYERLAGNPVHRREFRWYQRGVLLVRDHVKGTDPVWAECFIHLHPEVRATRTSDRSIRLEHRTGLATLTFVGPGRVTIERSWYLPEFGRTLENDVVVLSAGGTQIVNGFCLSVGDRAPDFDLDRGAVIDDQTFGW